MEFTKVFFVNICILTTLAYMAMLAHKYVLVEASGSLKYGLSVLAAIGAGWATMIFGLNIGHNIIFDLRFVPLIICTLAYSSPITLLFIGAGIGLARLSLGINEAAWAGCLNMVLLGFWCMVMNIVLKRTRWSYVTKMIIVILAVNIIYCIHIGIFGVIPAWDYFFQMMPATFPPSLLLSFFFAFMLYDFQVERRRVVDVQLAHSALQKQTGQLLETRKEVEQKAKQLLLASQYKSEFLVNMSHELRTPLNSIIALSQMIRDEERRKEDLETAEYAEIIYGSGQELLQLIDDILDLSKVEAGRLDILNEDVIVSEIAYVMQFHFRHIAEQKGLEFVINQDPGVPAVIRTDGLRLQQILRNLLSNAFKFTSVGRVTLHIRKAVCTEEESTGEWIAFTICDTGIGIKEHMQSAIFEAFQQADGSISRKYGGTGLGLAISRALTELLGGQLSVDSRESEGSAFTLYLPNRAEN
jgi:two-component system chemotaxis sensor kinase CheA